jgi:hypothetical protein
VTFLLAPQESRRSWNLIPSNRKRILQMMRRTLLGVRREEAHLVYLVIVKVTQFVYQKVNANIRLQFFKSF